MASPTILPSWTNIGPLTTIFTPPPLCETSNFLGLYNTDCNEGAIFSPNPASTQCWPAPVSSLANNNYYFSPGLCPSGWRGASAPTYLVTANDPAESVAVCCPSGWIAQQMLCFSILENPIEALYGSDCAQTPASNCNKCLVTPTEIRSQSRFAIYFPIVVRWHDGDFPSLPTPTSSIASSVTSSATSSATLPSASPGELSTGARVGIGVGVGTAALLFAGVFIWVCLRRRRDHARRSRDGGAGELVPYGTPELEANAAKIRLELAGEKCDVTPELPGEALGRTDCAGGLVAARGGEFGGAASTGYGDPRWPAELDAAPHHGMATVVAPVADLAVSEAAAEMPQRAKGQSPTGSGETRLEGYREAKPAIAKEESNTDVVPSTLAASPSDRVEERERLANEESRLAARRATLQETIRLLEEDERLKKEQEAVRRRLEELKKTS